MKKYYKQIEKYMSKNPLFNGCVHLLGGIGIGILITYPFVGDHPVRWGVAFLLASVVGHLWAATHS